MRERGEPLAVSPHPNAVNDPFLASDAVNESFTAAQPLAVSPCLLHRAVQPSGLTWTTSRRAQKVL